MSTRSLLAIQSDEKYVVAQYQHYDGYPDYMGVNILDWLKSNNNLEHLKSSLSKITLMAKKSNKDYEDDSICFESGADLLSTIIESKEPVKLLDSIEFTADSLFCEWAYVIDLDKNTFEIYQGFNEEPLNSTERFKEFESLKEHDSKYYPVRYLCGYQLDCLPSTDNFLKDCEGKK